MENGAVYSPTTEEDPGPARGARSRLAAYFNLGRLKLPHRVLKFLQLSRLIIVVLLSLFFKLDTLAMVTPLAITTHLLVVGYACARRLLSLLAFICEEVVAQCTLCGGLYFFELVSSSAFLLSLIILIVYCTPVYDKVDAEKVKLSDLYITGATGVVFLLASLIFAFTHDRTSAEIAAIVFGFLACIAFLVDGGLMFHEKRQASQLRKPETTTRAEALTEPLNA